MINLIIGGILLSILIYFLTKKYKEYKRKKELDKLDNYQENYDRLERNDSLLDRKIILQKKYNSIEEKINDGNE